MLANKDANDEKKIKKVFMKMKLINIFLKRIIKPNILQLRKKSRTIFYR